MYVYVYIYIYMYMFLDQETLQVISTAKTEAGREGRQVVRRAGKQTYIYIYI